MVIAHNDYSARINKLDAFFLWVASLSGIGFSIFIGYFRLPWIPYLPVFIIIFLAIYIGYIKGAILSDSFTERIRGWTYLIACISIYLPLTALSFNSALLAQGLPYSFSQNGATYIGMLLSSIITISYFFISKKFTNPYLYRSFNRQYDNVTRRILSRTFLSSFCFRVHTFCACSLA